MLHQDFIRIIKSFKYWYVGILSVLLISCEPAKIDITIDRGYSFFIAGHTYGDPFGINYGFYEPFENSIPFINQYPKIKFGVLTGDIVRVCDNQSFDSIDADIEKFNFPIHICPGNHDVKYPEIYENRYGLSFYQYRYHDDLFIILDGYRDYWNIRNEQLEFLELTLQQYADTSKNIFVFIHQLVFWKNDDIFSNIIINYPPYIPDSTNYWRDVEPLLSELNKPVFLISGDVGAIPGSTPFYYHIDNNITYLGSGMGNKLTDNMVYVTVNNDKTVSFQIYALQGDPNRYGKLEDYILN